jgi:hypothetical protein
VSSMPSVLEILRSQEFSFHRTSIPLPPELRPAWRVALLLSMVDHCWGKRATWRQLHVLNWALRSTHGRATLQRLRQGKPFPDDVVVRYEPSLNRAVDLAVGLRLMEWRDGRRLYLTDEGSAALQRLEATSALQSEREYLAAQLGVLTQSEADRILKAP